MALTPRHARWGSALLKAEMHHQYVRPLWGNINFKGCHYYAHRDLKATWKRLKGSLYQPQRTHPFPTKLSGGGGGALNRWVFTVQVNLPPPKRAGHINSFAKTTSKHANTRQNTHVSCGTSRQCAASSWPAYQFCEAVRHTTIPDLAGDIHTPHRPQTPRQYLLPDTLHKQFGRRRIMQERLPNLRAK